MAGAWMHDAKTYDVLGCVMAKPPFTGARAELAQFIGALGRPSVYDISNVSLDDSINTHSHSTTGSVCTIVA